MRIDHYLYSIPPEISEAFGALVGNTQRGGIYVDTHAHGDAMWFRDGSIGADEGLRHLALQQTRCRPRCARGRSSRPPVRAYQSQMHVVAADGNGGRTNAAG